MAGLVAGVDGLRELVHRHACGQELPVTLRRRRWRRGRRHRCGGWRRRGRRHRCRGWRRRGRRHRRGGRRRRGEGGKGGDDGSGDARRRWWRRRRRRRGAAGGVVGAAAAGCRDCPRKRLDCRVLINSCIAHRRVAHSVCALIDPPSVHVVACERLATDGDCGVAIEVCRVGADVGCHPTDRVVGAAAAGCRGEPRDRLACRVLIARSRVARSGRALLDPPTVHGVACERIDTYGGRGVAIEVCRVGAEVGWG